MALPETNNLLNLVNKERLTTYDTELKAYIAAKIKVVSDAAQTSQDVDDKISAAISELGTIVNYKGTKDSISELPEDAEAGDLWFVKQADKDDATGTGDFYEEYLYTGTVWEYLGKTGVSLNGYVTETSLYKGTDGTGTEKAPAEGTTLSNYETKADLYAGADGAGTTASPADGTVLATVNTSIAAAAKKGTDAAAQATAIETYLSNATIMSEDDVKALFPKD